MTFRLSLNLSNQEEYNNKATRVWFLREQKHTSDGLWPSKPGFQAKDHHECVSAPSEITQVWFYIYPMPQKPEKQLFILEFHTPSSP
jgi:hypothetical protein